MRDYAATAVLICLANLISFAQQQKPDSTELPTTEEIKLVVNQAETAFTLYKQSIDMEAELPSLKKDKSSVEKDLNVFQQSQEVIAGLKKHPELFNGIGGLFLLTSLDDASRNAALCSASGGLDAMAEAASGGNDSAYRLVATSQNCLNISMHLYTVSESVNALFSKYVKAQWELNGEATSTINQCAEALRRATAKK